MLSRLSQPAVRSVRLLSLPQIGGSAVVASDNGVWMSAAEREATVAAFAEKQERRNTFWHETLKILVWSDFLLNSSIRCAWFLNRYFWMFWIINLKFLFLKNNCKEIYKESGWILINLKMFFRDQGAKFF